jgi:hypothetical protein
VAAKKFCEQTVVGRHENMTITFDHDNVTLRADAWIDNAQVYRAGGKVTVCPVDPKASLWRPLRRNIVSQINHLGIGHATQDDATHDGRKGALVTEVSG